jgi:hypothetical protein
MSIYGAFWYGQGQNRTADTKIFSLLLYRLSYLPIRAEFLLLPILGDRCKQDSRGDQPLPLEPSNVIGPRHVTPILDRWIKWKLPDCADFVPGNLTISAQKRQFLGYG